MAESNSIDMNATTGDERDIEIHSSFTNFLQNEDPFFCSWGRDSNANKTETVEKEEDGSLEKSELTHHVPNPLTSDKIIGFKAEKDNSPETVKQCGGQSTGDSNACKNVIGSNKENEDASLHKTELTHHVPDPITTDKIIGCKEKDNAPETVKLCGASTGPGDSSAYKNVTGSNKEKEDASLQKTELTHHVPNPITTDKIIGCKEKDIAPENVKPCGQSTMDSNACKNVTGCNKEKEDASLQKTELTHHIIGCKEKDIAPETVKLCGPSTGDSSACKNVTGSNEEKDKNVTGCNKDKEDASLQKTELTHHVPNPITTDKETKLDQGLISFIKKVNSIFTRWSWDHNPSKNELGSTSTKEGENLSFPSLMSRFVVSLKTLGLWLLFLPILLPLGLWLLFFSPFLIIDRNNAQDKRCCMSAKKRRNRKTKRDLTSLAPVFTKVQDLHPEMENINLILKVVKVKIVSRKGQMPVTESFVGDDSGIIIFRAVGADKINKVKAGSTIILRKAKIFMYRGSMRLGGCRAEDIEEAPPAAFTVKEDCNLSVPY